MCAKDAIFSWPHTLGTEPLSVLYRRYLQLPFFKSSCTVSRHLALVTHYRLGRGSQCRFLLQKEITSYLRSLGPCLLRVWLKKLRRPAEFARFACVSLPWLCVSRRRLFDWTRTSWFCLEKETQGRWAFLFAWPAPGRHGDPGCGGDFQEGGARCLSDGDMWLALGCRVAGVRFCLREEPFARCSAGGSGGVCRRNSWRSPPSNAQSMLERTRLHVEQFLAFFKCLTCFRFTLRA